MKYKKLSLLNSFSFIDKKVLISGASSGIGRAIAYRFAEAGANLILLDSDIEGLRQTRDRCISVNRAHDCYQIDLSEKEEIDSFWANIIDEELPDIIVNNAGIYPVVDFLSADINVLKKTLDVNMISVYWMCQNFIRKKAKRGGIIVNISSIEALLPFKRDLVHYTMSKSGVIALSRSLARDYGSAGFRTNVVLPGAIKTKGTMTLVKEAVIKGKFNLIKTGYDFKQRLATGRWGDPDEIAKVVLFLSSDLASYMQGAVVPVDGGFLSS